LRDRYIRVILGIQPVDDLIAEIAGRRLPEDVSGRIQKLLLAQYERQKMYASCAWFFEDFDRIEPKNSVAYAAQAIILACQATGVDMALQFSADMERVVSQRTGWRGNRVLADHLMRTNRQNTGNLSFW